MAGPPDTVLPGDEPPTILGRYALFDEIAAGGMATVHLGRMIGPVGFSRIVAIKRLHPQYARDPDFVSMFLDEARLVSRIQHPNVASTIDVMTEGGEAFLVMDYIAGESLYRLLRRSAELGEPPPLGHVATIMVGALHGLHAAHEAKSELREPLNIVHRDVSPQNVLVGTDGVARVLDFGVAKAALRAQSTDDSQVKGKLSYMSPEQLNGEEIDRRADVFSAGVILWEALCGRRLFDGADAGEMFAKVLTNDIPSPRTVVFELPDAVDQVVMKALERDLEARYQTAREFAIELEAAVSLSTSRAVGDWVEHVGGDALTSRARVVSRIEQVDMDAEAPTARKSSRPPPAEIEREPSFSGPRPRGAGAGRPRPPLPTKRRKPAQAVEAPAPAPAPAAPASETQRLALMAIIACIAGGVLAYALFRSSPSASPPPAGALPSESLTAP